jgi:hypothetical protein
MKEKVIITRFDSFVKSIYGINESQTELVVSGKGSDPWEYKKSGDSYFTRKKGTKEWVETSGVIKKSIERIFGNITPSDKSSTVNGDSKTDSFPIKTPEEGNKFREWTNEKYPKTSKSLQLDRTGSHNNSYIKKAWVHEIKPGITLGSLFMKEGNIDSRSKENPKSGIIISDSANRDLLNKINFDKISNSDSALICNIDNPECAGFVNDYSDKIKIVGDAWHAHNNETMGKRIWTCFHNLNSSAISGIKNLWIKIHKNGGGKKNGKYNGEAMKLVDSIVPKTLPPNIKLEINDVVGIYYPPSKNHEKAFYNGGAPSTIPGGSGKGYFLNKKGTPLKPGEEAKEGNSISSGTGWGMNTHVGIVGAMKNNEPIIFHNVEGAVYADPVNKIKNGGRIAWIRRAGGNSKILK